VSEIEAASAVLTGLAQARERFAALARRLGGAAHVTAARSGIDARAYESGTCIEVFAEADLDTGNVVCWWLDVRQGDGGWIAEPSIFVQHSAGQDALAEIAPRSIRTDAEFAEVLNDVVAALVAHPERTLEAARTWTAA
jgi:hypothetical protein